MQHLLSISEYTEQGQGQGQGGQDSFTLEGCAK